MDDKQLLQFDWLSDMLENEVLISGKELGADLDKSEHSFLRKLLADSGLDDEYKDINRSDTDVFDSTPPSTNLSHAGNNLFESVDVTEQSDDVLLARTESETVENKSKRGKLHFQISRMSSMSDRSFVDESTDSLLKTPAGFYDRTCLSSYLSIPPLFDYSSGLTTDPCHFSDVVGSWNSTDDSVLSSILEDEKWSEGSEISSVDIDASSISALSPADFTEDGTLSIAEDEEKLSQQEERVVLSVVQNVLSDEAVALNVDDFEKGESHRDDECQHSPEIPSTQDKENGQLHRGDECQHSPEIPSTQDKENRQLHRDDECQHSPEIPSMQDKKNCQLCPTSTTELSKLNPLAQPFFAPKMLMQRVPIVFTPRMPTVVVPVQLAYTRLLPVATNKSFSSKQPEKNVKGNSRRLLPSNIPNSKLFITLVVVVKGS